MAAVNNRSFVLPDDVKKLAQSILAHRLILKPESRLRRITPQNVVNEIVMEARVPVLKRQSEGEDYMP